MRTAAGLISTAHASPEFTRMLTGLSGLSGLSGVAGGAAPIPVAPAGALRAIIFHPFYTASDASHLVPCAAGDKIRWVRDAVTGTWYEQSDADLRLTQRFVNGRWTAEGTAGTYIDVGTISAKLCGVTALSNVGIPTPGLDYYGLICRADTLGGWFLTSAGTNPGSWYPLGVNTYYLDGGVSASALMPVPNAFGRIMGITTAGLNAPMRIGQESTEFGRNWKGYISGLAFYAEATGPNLVELDSWLEGL